MCAAFSAGIRCDIGVRIAHGLWMPVSISYDPSTFLVAHLSIPGFFSNCALVIWNIYRCPVRNISLFPLLALNFQRVADEHRFFLLMSKHEKYQQRMFAQVGPRDGRYGVGRYRLAIQAGATDCFFRLLFWNRAVTAEVNNLGCDTTAVHVTACETRTGIYVRRRWC